MSKGPNKTEILAIVNYYNFGFSSAKTVGELKTLLAEIPDEAKLTADFSSGHGEYSDVIYVYAEHDENTIPSSWHKTDFSQHNIDPDWE